jgi:ABC-type phosphate/phosphonate transport system substrate-binding protein
MQRKLTLAATTLAALMATAAAAGVDRIQEVDVSADISAIQNAKAAEYWATLEADLEAAIGLRVTERLGEDGARVLVDIREVELANAFDRAVNLGDAVLVGQVNIVDDTDNRNYDAYELSVSLETARVIVPEGQTIVFGLDDRATYQTLVDAFAEGVVERLN